MSFIGLKTGPRAQRRAVFSIGLKTGDVLELTISGAKPAAGLHQSSSLKTPATLFHTLGPVDSAANLTRHPAPFQVLGTQAKPSINPIETHGVITPRSMNRAKS